MQPPAGKQTLVLAAAYYIYRIPSSLYQNQDHTQSEPTTMSSFKGVYQNFLASPSTALLNDEASLNYITTLTTINSAAAVVKHFEAHQKILKKTEEKALNSIENDNAICLEIETTIEFTSGGGVCGYQTFDSGLYSTHHKRHWLLLIRTLTAFSFIGIPSWLRRQFPCGPCRYLPDCES